jgi:hypothetical protein
MISRDSEHEIISSVRPLRVKLSSKAKRSLAHDSEQGIERVFKSGAVDYTETVSSVTPIQLDANPQNAPNITFRSLQLIAYDEAIVNMTREYVDGEYRLTLASILLSCSTLPPELNAELYIQADEADAEAEIDLDDPQFYIKVPDLDTDGYDTIPLNYEKLQDILDGLVEQANPFVAITSPDRTIMENLQALLVTASERSVHREASYRFTDPTIFGHTVVKIAKNNHILSTDQDVQSVHHRVTVESAHALPDNQGIASSIYDFEKDSKGITAEISLSYDKQFEDSLDPIEEFETLVGTDTKSWLEDLTHIELGSNGSPRSERTKPSRFGSYILNGLSLIANPQEIAHVERVDD